MLVGLYVRLNITETPQFLDSLKSKKQVKIPVFDVVTKYKRQLVVGTLIAVATFVLFYLMTVFTLSWATSVLGYARRDFLLMQLISVLFFGLAVPFSAWLADRFGRVIILIFASLAIAVFGLWLSTIFDTVNQLQMTFFLSLGMALMGMTYGPLGTILSELFPTEVRYTGASLTFNLAGILGASFAPFIATWLAGNYGLAYVGFYLTGAAMLTLCALLKVKN